MTPQEHLSKMKELLDKSTQNVVRQVMVPAANEMLAEIKNRIQIDGKNSVGSKIGLGMYSTKPIYASKKSFVSKGGFAPQGKNREYKASTSKKTGEQTLKLTAVSKKNGDKARKTMYLPGGYKQFREIQGRPVNVINETLSGDTMLAYQQQVRDKDILQGFTTVKSSKIRQGQEKRFGQVFRPSQDELKEFTENITKELTQLQLDALR
jgi:hypothetical protein